MFIGEVIGGLFVGFLIFFYLMIVFGISKTDEMNGRKIDKEIKIGSLIIFAIPTISLIVWVLASEKLGMLLGAAVAFGYMFNKTFPSQPK